jgi:hypothetical protein
MGTQLVPVCPRKATLLHASHFQVGIKTGAKKGGAEMGAHKLRPFLAALESILDAAQAADRPTRNNISSSAGRPHAHTTDSMGGHVRFPPHRRLRIQGDKGRGRVRIQVHSI